jgi:hypothetical protein
MISATPRKYQNGLNFTKPALRQPTVLLRRGGVCGGSKRKPQQQKWNKVEM